MQENEKVFTPIEESVSFYARNDFAVMNHLLTGNLKDIWKYALLSHQDDRGIMEEYESGIRPIESDYDIKWLNALKKRAITELDDATKEKIIQTARDDIANLLNAMYPAKETMHLYRTAWIDGKAEQKAGLAYSREYKNLHAKIGTDFEIRAISSYSLTPYREDEDTGSDFYRYELHVPVGMKILELDAFATHNEEGEVLLPPMKCRLIRMKETDIPRCRGIAEIECIEPVENFE